MSTEECCITVHVPSGSRPFTLHRPVAGDELILGEFESFIGHDYTDAIGWEYQGVRTVLAVRKDGGVEIIQQAGGKMREIDSAGDDRIEP